MGTNSGRVGASYAVATVGGGRGVGGLAGWNGSSGEIRAAYAVAAVSGDSDVGGLAGINTASGTIRAAYAVATVDGGDNVGGLVGVADNAVIEVSYWDTDVSDLQPDSSSIGVGKTVVELQTPTGYTGIYSDWNVDANYDGMSGGDDPWDFGTDRQYPVLQYGGLSTAMQLATLRPLTLRARVFLQGAYDPQSGRMKTGYGGLLPTRQPYGVAPWGHVSGYDAGLPGLLGDAAFGLSEVTSTIVDWVLVELRATPRGISAAASSTRLDRRSALLLSDGAVVGVDSRVASAPAVIALGNVVFSVPRVLTAAPSDFYVLIDHRNHLPVMTTAVSGAACGAADYCADFTRGQSWQDGQHDVGNGVYAMFAGDTDRDGDIDADDEAAIRRHNLTGVGGGGHYTAGADGGYAVDGDPNFDGDVLSGDRRFILINDARRSCAVCSP